MNPSPEPTCPACGGTPASMIEDGYSTDLVPWWRHYAQKFNPFRLVRRKVVMRWIPFTTAAVMSGYDYVVVLFKDGSVASYDREDLHTFRYYFDTATHWCPLPPLP